MIERECDKWFLSKDCTIKSCVHHIEKKGKLRDAQIEAIKVYLFLKIKCENKPLCKLFTEGAFNTITPSEIDALKMANKDREFLQQNKAAIALYEYATQKDSKGNLVSQKIADAIRNNPTSIDYEKFFKDAFYGVSYTDYLFSLPMGAGKTFLMMAFIYLDLYFALQNSTKNVFAHNFIILVPSGLKSSVVPSLRSMQEFDGEWLFPKEIASKIKQLIHFETLDLNKTSKKSNKIKNPNVQKIASCQPFEELIGLVAITNAEKVILDGVHTNELPFEYTEDQKEQAANELRHIIGELPRLAIFIDEVHHAASEEKKLRAVVTKWAREKDVVNVLGFTGTPYLEKAERIAINANLKVASLDISNTVDYYPLSRAIGNFLKRPLVKISDSQSSLTIIEAGVRCFLDKYKDTIYHTLNGDLCAKLAIYCGQGIDFLEEDAFSCVLRVIKEYGLDADAILKFHGGNKNHPTTVESEKEFLQLDSSISKKRIILLCQIGKEGWNCKSLTGIILPQEGDCPTNMVLQTSCRCLRQVVQKGETALIYLNKNNGQLLESQLAQQQHMTLDEFQKETRDNTRPKANRVEYLKLPPIEYYQMRVEFIQTTAEQADPSHKIQYATEGTEIADEKITTKESLSDDEVGTVEFVTEEQGCEYATFYQWVYLIAKEGLNCTSMHALLKYENELRQVFNRVTYIKAGERYYSTKFDQKRVRSNIRKTFCDKQTAQYKQEIFSDKASLLFIDGYEKYSPVRGDDAYYPDEVVVENILKTDSGEKLIDDKTQTAIDSLEEAGQHDVACALKNKFHVPQNKDSSFHYLPYHTDSELEKTFLQKILALEDIEKFGIEVYYNGDRALTEFKIDCYKKQGSSWRRVGYYTPDFLIIKRNTQGDKIDKAIIVETKGKLYASDPNFVARREFTQSEFLEINNKRAGYEKFRYLYLEDSPDSNKGESNVDRLLAICDREIKAFFR